MGPDWKEQLVKSPKVRDNTFLLENLNKIQTACCREKKNIKKGEKEEIEVNQKVL